MNGNPYPFRWTLPVGAFLIILVVAWWVWPRAKIWVRITRARIQQTAKTETTEKSQHRVFRTSPLMKRFRTSPLMERVVVLVVYSYLTLSVLALVPSPFRGVVNIARTAFLIILILYYEEIKDIIRNRVRERSRVKESYK